MMECKHRIDGCCSIASDLACLPLKETRTSDQACSVCQFSTEPMNINQVTVSLAISQLHRTGQFDLSKHGDLQELAMQKCVGEKITLTEIPKNCGVGAILARKLSWAFRKDDSCVICRYRAAKMNEWGPDKCEENMELILSWLRHAAKKRRVPFFKEAVRIVVMSAIKEERRKLCCKKK